MSVHLLVTVVAVFLQRCLSFCPNRRQAVKILMYIYQIGLTDENAILSWTFLKCWIVFKTASLTAVEMRIRVVSLSFPQSVRLMFAPPQMKKGEMVVY